MRRLITAIFVCAAFVLAFNGDATGGAKEPEGMVKIPAGPFVMGSDAGNKDAKPKRKVTLKAYYIDKYEVTNAKYKVYLDAMKAAKKEGKEVRAPVPSCKQQTSKGALQTWDIPNGTFPQDLANHPVTCVSKIMAELYCQWEGKRLPTEAEWEKAARGADERTFVWGNEWNAANANHGSGKAPWTDDSDGFARTAPVGSFAKDVSPFGVYDMGGNVWEWTSDIYSASYYSWGPAKDPTGATPETLPESEAPFRAGLYAYSVRGGAWPFGEDYFKTYLRYSRFPTYRDDAGGFRCAK